MHFKNTIQFKTIKVNIKEKNTMRASDMNECTHACSVSHIGLGGLCGDSVFPS